MSTAAHAADPNLVILVETGTSRDGVPVLKPHPDAAAVSGLLARGFSGRLLRLYQYEQEYLRRAAGWQPEPAYLLLWGRQGGFPRFGFYLEDQDKRRVGYVDLHKSAAGTMPGDPGKPLLSAALGGEHIIPVLAAGATA